MVSREELFVLRSCFIAAAVSGYELETNNTARKVARFELVHSERGPATMAIPGLQTIAMHCQQADLNDCTGFRFQSLDPNVHKGLGA